MFKCRLPYTPKLKAMTKTKQPFWETKTLKEMSEKEWESLCDGCAKCCLNKLEDEETEEVFFTRVVCRFLDEEKCRCTVYEERTTLEPMCIKLEPGNFENIKWMPNTCAYRLLNEGKPLPLWHPLITGSRKAMVANDQTVTGKVVSEEFVHPDGFEEHIIDWASH